MVEMRDVTLPTEAQTEGVKRASDLEPERGLEPLTPSLPWRCSAD